MKLRKNVEIILSYVREINKNNVIKNPDDVSAWISSAEDTITGMIRDMNNHINSPLKKYNDFLNTLSLKEKQELLELYYLGRDENTDFTPEIHSEIDCDSKLYETRLMLIIFPKAIDILEKKFPDIAKKIL